MIDLDGGPRRVVCHLIAAARPNFMKVAPLYHALAAEPAGAAPVLVHTGQHYDAEHVGRLLRRPRPARRPTSISASAAGSHAEQTGRVMIAYERGLPARTGPTGWSSSATSTRPPPARSSARSSAFRSPISRRGCAAATARMPEEINRIVTDALADLLWTPSPDADANLLREGVPAERIARVGNIMID